MLMDAKNNDQAASSVGTGNEESVARAAEINVSAETSRPGATSKDAGKRTSGKSKKNVLKTRSFRSALIAVLFVFLCACLIIGISAGTLSGFGWDTISALCPLGAVETAVATKLLLPNVLVSFVVMAVLVLLVGRAFCSWICPVNVLNRIKTFFQSPKKRNAEAQKRKDHIRTIANQELAQAGGCAPSACAACGKCMPVKHATFDSRHAVLGGAILSTFIFGFPVFCLICPVGLSFATVVVIWRGFSAGDGTWSMLLIPLLLFLEIFVLRKWCIRICPISALMNLAGRFSRVALPVIDDAKCIETAHGRACNECAVVCEMDINIRHPEFGELTMADCSRCRNCIDACPTHAISMPLVGKKPSGELVLNPGVTVKLDTPKDSA